MSTLCGSHRDPSPDAIAVMVSMYCEGGPCLGNSASHFSRDSGSVPLWGSINNPYIPLKQGYSSPTSAQRAYGANLAARHDPARLSSGAFCVEAHCQAGHPRGTIHFQDLSKPM